MARRRSRATSGQFVVGGDDVAILADSRYTIQAAREATEARVVEAYHDLPTRWPELMTSVGARRVAVEAGFVSHAAWERLAAAAPDVELVPVEGWVEADRAIKEPAEIERIAAACAVADRALAALLPEIRTGHDRGRPGASAGMADAHRRRRGARVRRRVPVGTRGGPAAWRARRPPDPRRGRAPVRLRRPGRGLSERHDPDPVRRRAGAARPRHLRASSRGPRRPRSRRSRRGRCARPATDASPRCRAAGRSTRIARGVIEAAGHGAHFGHGTGHGIGLATHEAPSLGRLASDEPLPSPTVFSVEPGVYLEGEMGVRIEDLVVLDASAGSARAPDPVPARGARRRGLTRAGRIVCYDRGSNRPYRPPSLRASGDRPAAASRPGARPHDQHR